MDELLMDILSVVVTALASVLAFYLTRWLIKLGNKAGFELDETKTEQAIRTAVLATAQTFVKEHRRGGTWDQTKAVEAMNKTVINVKTELDAAGISITKEMLEQKIEAVIIQHKPILRSSISKPE